MGNQRGIQTKFQAGVPPLTPPPVVKIAKIREKAYPDCQIPFLGGVVWLSSVRTRVYHWKKVESNLQVCGRNRASKDHINRSIRQNMASAILPVPGLGSRMSDPCVCFNIGPYTTLYHIILCHRVIYHTILYHKYYTKRIRVFMWPFGLLRDDSKRSSHLSAAGRISGSGGGGAWAICSTSSALSGFNDKKKAYIHICVCIYIYVCVFLCMYMYFYMCMYMHAYPFTYKHKCAASIPELCINTPYAGTSRYAYVNSLTLRAYRHCSSRGSGVALNQGRFGVVHTCCLCQVLTGGSEHWGRRGAGGFRCSILA